MEKRRNSPVLYRFSEVEFQDQEGFVPSTPACRETMESMVGAQFFSSMDLKSGFLASTNVGKVPAVYRLHRGKPRCV